MIMHPPAIVVGAPRSTRCAWCGLHVGLHQRQLSAEEQSLLDARDRARQEWFTFANMVDDVLRWFQRGEAVEWMQKQLTQKKADHVELRRAVRISEEA